MNIYDLRNIMKVEYYNKNKHGCSISYYRTNAFSVIKLNNEQLLQELTAIGSIEEGDNYDAYILSQWDALNIAIRFELAKEMEKDIDNSDLGAAIKKLTHLQNK